MSLAIDGSSQISASAGWNPSQEPLLASNLNDRLQAACNADPLQQQNDLDSIAQRQQLLTEAYAEADRTGDSSLREQADGLAKLYHDQNMSALANDSYHHTSAVCSTAPTGYSRASESPELLARFNLTEADLAPQGSGFRAEIYLPDPAVHGDDALPVLAFKGTDVTNPNDWANNFTQGVGKPTEFYNRAMDLAMQINTATDGKFELTGHSLGGGMASAASAVTGADATIFNSAGLHDSTAREYLAASNTTPFDVDQRVTAYQVEGEVLTGIQQAASGITPHHADQLASVIRNAIGVSGSPLGGEALGRLGVEVPDLSGLRHATGADLRAMPQAAGVPITLPALNADGSARPAIVPLAGENGLIAHAENVVDIVEAHIAAGQAPGNAVRSGGRTVDAVLDSGAEKLSTLLKTGGNVVDQALQDGGSRIDRVLDVGGVLLNAASRHLGNATDRVLDIGGSLANRTLDIGGHVGGAVLEGAGNTLGNLVGGLGSHVPGPAGRVLQQGGQAISSASTNVADSARNLLDSTGDRVGGLLDSAGDALSHVMNRGGELANRAMDAGGDALSSTLSRAGALTSTVSAHVADIGHATLDRAGDAVGWLGDQLGGAMRTLGGVAGGGVGVVHGGVATVSDPVLRNAPAALAEMATRHGGDIVDNGIADVVEQSEQALIDRLQN